MKPTCKKCGADVPETATVCPKCKTLDPFGQVSDNAERFNEEQVESAAARPFKEQRKPSE